MPKSKERIIIGALIAVIIIGAVLFNVRLKAERAKTAAFLQENFSKGENNASIQVKIKEETPEGQYNDSLYYTLDQWASKTPADIEADKKARVDKWLETIKNPAPAAEPTKEELPAPEQDLNTPQE
jgi:GTPase Era involved in 16S rRNA processing